MLVGLAVDGCGRGEGHVAAAGQRGEIRVDLDGGLQSDRAVEADRVVGRPNLQRAVSGIEHDAITHDDVRADADVDRAFGEDRRHRAGRAGALIAVVLAEDHAAVRLRDRQRADWIVIADVVVEQHLLRAGVDRQAVGFSEVAVDGRGRRENHGAAEAGVVRVDVQARQQRDRSVEPDGVIGGRDLQRLRSSVEHDAGTGDDVFGDADVDVTVGRDDRDGADRPRPLIGVRLAKEDPLIGLPDRESAQRFEPAEVVVEPHLLRAGVDRQVIVLVRLAVDGRGRSERHGAAESGVVRVDRHDRGQRHRAVEADGVVGRRDRQQVRSRVEHDAAAADDMAADSDVDRIVRVDDVYRAGRAGPLIDVGSSERHRLAERHAAVRLSDRQSSQRLHGSEVVVEIDLLRAGVDSQVVVLAGLAVDGRGVRERHGAADARTVRVDVEMRGQRDRSIETDRIVGRRELQRPGAGVEHDAAGDDMLGDTDVDRAVGRDRRDGAGRAGSEIGVRLAEDDSAVGLSDRQRSERFGRTEVVVEQDLLRAGVDRQVVMLARLAVDRRVGSEGHGAAEAGDVRVDADVRVQRDRSVEPDGLIGRRDLQRAVASVEHDAADDHVAADSDVDRPFGRERRDRAGRAGALIGVRFTEDHAAVRLRDRQRSDRIDEADVVVEQDTLRPGVDRQPVGFAELAIDGCRRGERHGAAGPGGVRVDVHVRRKRDRPVEANGVIGRRDGQRAAAGVEHDPSGDDVIADTDVDDAVGRDRRDWPRGAGSARVCSTKEDHACGDDGEVAQFLISQDSRTEIAVERDRPRAAGQRQRVVLAGAGRSLAIDGAEERDVAAAIAAVEPHRFGEQHRSVKRNRAVGGRDVRAEFRGVCAVLCERTGERKIRTGADDEHAGIRDLDRTGRQAGGRGHVVGEADRSGRRTAGESRHDSEITVDGHGALKIDRLGIGDGQRVEPITGDRADSSREDDVLAGVDGQRRSGRAAAVVIESAGKRQIAAGRQREIVRQPHRCLEQHLVAGRLVRSEERVVIRTDRDRTVRRLPAIDDDVARVGGSRSRDGRKGDVSAGHDLLRVAIAVDADAVAGRARCQQVRALNRDVESRVEPCIGAARPFVEPEAADSIEVGIGGDRQVARRAGGRDGRRDDDVPGR